MTLQDTVGYYETGGIMSASKEWVSIATSLVKAQEAVQADHDGNYSKALKLYKECVLKLDAHVLACVSDEEREKLIEIVRWRIGFHWGTFFPFVIFLLKSSLSLSLSRLPVSR